MSPLERCDAEIALCEAELRAGNRDIHGLTRGLVDWSNERRLIARPICVDLFCGLGGWTEGFLAEGYRVVGFDNHRHEYGEQRYPGQLVLQDVLTIHGSQFKDAAVIVASPPCQNYSYLAMPWSRSTDPNNSKAAKALRKKWETEGPDNRLFDACFRIQREACEAAGRYIPLIVENVRGAQPWVGPARANYGSFYLWGDVAMVGNRIIAGTQREFGAGLKVPKGGSKVPGFRFDGSGGSFQTASVEATGHKRNPDGTDHPTGLWFRIADSSQGDRGQKVAAYSDPRRNGGKGVHLTSPHENSNGLKIGGDRFSDPQSTCRKHGSRSQARKAASAQIAKIPLPLSQYIAKALKPKVQ